MMVQQTVDPEEMLCILDSFATEDLPVPPEDNHATLHNVIANIQHVKVKQHPYIILEPFFI